MAQPINSDSPSVYITGLITSQVISNVPAAILLANFTPHLSALFLGVNIGGLGSLVASLANLLALKQLLPFNDEQPLHHFFDRVYGPQWTWPVHFRPWWLVLFTPIIQLR